MPKKKDKFPLRHTYSAPLRAQADMRAWDQVELTAKELASLDRYRDELPEDFIASVADDFADALVDVFSIKKYKPSLRKKRKPKCGWRDRIVKKGSKKP